MHPPVIGLHIVCHGRCVQGSAVVYLHAKMASPSFTALAGRESYARKRLELKETYGDYYYYYYRRESQKCEACPVKAGFQRQRKGCGWCIGMYIAIIRQIKTQGRENPETVGIGRRTCSRVACNT